MHQGRSLIAHNIRYGTRPSPKSFFKNKKIVVNQQLKANKTLNSKKKDAIELVDFKTKINLSEFMAAYGWKIDNASQKSVEMALESRRIVIKKAEDSGYHLYFEKGFKSDNSGTIIDFCQKELKISKIHEVRFLLRKWRTWRQRPKLNKNDFQRWIKKSSKTEHDLNVLYSWMIDLSQYLKSGLKITFEKDIHLEEKKAALETAFSYLKEIGIDLDLLEHNRFTSKIKVDNQGNLIFPHYAGADLCGWESISKNFRSFPEGSKTSVWFSNKFGHDENIIIFNSPLSAFAYYSLFPEKIKKSACVSTSMGWSDTTKKMLRGIIKKYQNLNFKLAFNNDSMEIKYHCDLISEKGGSQDPVVRKKLIKEKMSNSFDRAATELIRSILPDKYIEIIHPKNSTWQDDLKDKY